jgi:Secretion system C-terminal sorting domain
MIIGTKLAKFYKGIRFFILLICINFSFLNILKAQNCPQDVDFNFVPSKAGMGINWNQFPEFSLPFKVVYGGVSRFADLNAMKLRGYSHFSNPNKLETLAPKNRAFILYGVAFPEQVQPWYSYKSPWNNDIGLYQKHWAKEIERVKFETGSKDFIDVDFFVFDIERQIKSNDSILLLKKNAFTPADIKNFSDEAFISRYKRDLQSLYYQAANYTIKNGKLGANTVSSYSDSPILNTFLNIQGKTWQNWKTDLTGVNPIVYNFDANKVGGNYYDMQHVMTPSAYFYYDYPHPFAGEYLSYLLFQCEANRAWSDKEMVLFVWEKYSYTPAYVHKKIKPWMAEAMAIFPFFAGAKGLWLWEQPSLVKDEDDLSNYEYFTKGLYRLSKHKAMFEGNYELVEAISARDYNENKLPIWRGVVNNNSILVTAQNPYAKNENELATIQMNYKGWNQTVTLKGYEVFLCKYDLSGNNILGNLNAENFDVKVFPNPSSEGFTVSFDLQDPQRVDVSLFDINGRLLFEDKTNSATNKYKKEIILKGISPSEVILSVKTDSFKTTKRVVLIK